MGNDRMCFYEESQVLYEKSSVLREKQCSIVEKNGLVGACAVLMCERLG